MIVTISCSKNLSLSVLISWICLFSLFLRTIYSAPHARAPYILAINIPMHVFTCSCVHSRHHHQSRINSPSVCVVLCSVVSSSKSKSYRTMTRPCKNCLCSPISFFLFLWNMLWIIQPFRPHACNYSANDGDGEMLENTSKSTLANLFGFLRGLVTFSSNVRFQLCQLSDNDPEYTINHMCFWNSFYIRCDGEHERLYVLSRFLLPQWTLAHAICPVWYLFCRQVENRRRRHNACRCRGQTAKEPEHMNNLGWSL